MVSRIDRAKLFLPFSALAPLQQALREKEKEQVQKLELSDEMIIDISNVLQKISNKTSIEIEYYYDRRYIKLVGIVEEINYIKKYLVIKDYKIFFDDILKICII